MKTTGRTGSLGNPSKSFRSRVQCKICTGPDSLSHVHRINDLIGSVVQVCSAPACTRRRRVTPCSCAGAASLDVLLDSIAARCPRGKMMSMTTSMPYGYPLPQMPTLDPAQAMGPPDARAMVQAEDDGAGLRASDYVLGGGIVASLALLAYFAVKNDAAHVQLRNEVAEVDGHLIGYQGRHAQEHAVIAQRQAQIDANLQGQINVLGNVLNPYGHARSMVEPMLPMNVRSRFRELNPLPPVAKTVYAEPLLPQVVEDAVFPSTPPIASSVSAPVALVTQPFGSRVSYAASLPVEAPASMPLVSRRVSLPSHIESAITEVMPAIVAESVPTLVEEAPVMSAVPASVAPMTVPAVTVPAYRFSTAPRSTRSSRASTVATLRG